MNTISFSLKRYSQPLQTFYDAKSGTRTSNIVYARANSASYLPSSLSPITNIVRPFNIRSIPETEQLQALSTGSIINNSTNRTRLCCEELDLYKHSIYRREKLVDLSDRIKSSYTSLFTQYLKGCMLSVYQLMFSCFPAVGQLGELPPKITLNHRTLPNDPFFLPVSGGGSNIYIGLRNRNQYAESTSFPYRLDMVFETSYVDEEADRSPMTHIINSCIIATMNIPDCFNLAILRSLLRDNKYMKRSIKNLFMLMAVEGIPWVFKRFVDKFNSCNNTTLDTKWIPSTKAEVITYINNSFHIKDRYEGKTSVLTALTNEDLCNYFCNSSLVHNFMLFTRLFDSVSEIGRSRIDVGGGLDIAEYVDVPNLSSLFQADRTALGAPIPLFYPMLKPEVSFSDFDALIVRMDSKLVDLRTDVVVNGIAEAARNKYRTYSG